LQQFIEINKSIPCRKPAKIFDQFHEIFAEPENIDRFTKIFVIAMKFTFSFISAICCSLFAFGQQGIVKSPFRQDSIGFISQPSGYKMAGTLSYPAKKGRCPAVLLVWGTGPHTRDEVVSKFPTFKIIADYFNQIGYAVLRIDKRGFGKSEGPKGESETVSTTADLESDIYSAVQFLKKQPYIDTANIGMVGHSEGAWITEMIAAKDTSIRWLALLGAPVINGEEIQTNQMCSNLLRLGAKPDVVEKVRPQIIRYMDFIKSGYANDSIYYAIGRDFLLAHGVAEKDITKKFIDQLLDGFKTPWWRYYLSGTSADVIKQLKMPVYFIYGGEDENVAPATNLLPLLDAIKQSGNQHMSVTILPGLDHFFEVKTPTGWTLSDKLCPAIGFWLQTDNF
jgi:pimeloyl-ACP methyl ester carboxylesterase